MGRCPCDGTKLFLIEIDNVATWCNLAATRWEIEAGHWEKLSHCTLCLEKLWIPFLCSFQDSAKQSWLTSRGVGDCPASGSRLNSTTLGRSCQPTLTTFIEHCTLIKAKLDALRQQKNWICRSVRGTEVFEPAPYLWDLWDHEFIPNWVL